MAHALVQSKYSSSALEVVRVIGKLLGAWLTMLPCVRPASKDFCDDQSDPLDSRTVGLIRVSVDCLPSSAGTRLLDRLPPAQSGLVKRLRKQPVRSGD
jgi:hypothetical protein